MNEYLRALFGSPLLFSLSCKERHLLHTDGFCTLSAMLEDHSCFMQNREGWVVLENTCLIWFPSVLNIQRSEKK